MRPLFLSALFLTACPNPNTPEAVRVECKQGTPDDWICYRICFEQRLNDGADVYVRCGR